MSNLIIVELIKILGIIITLVVTCIGLHTANKNKKSIKEIHVMINSRFDQFLKIQKELGHAEGKAEEKADEKTKNGSL